MASIFAAPVIVNLVFGQRPSPIGSGRELLSRRIFWRLGLLYCPSPVHPPKGCTLSGSGLRPADVFLFETQNDLFLKLFRSVGRRLRFFFLRGAHWRPLKLPRLVFFIVVMLTQKPCQNLRIFRLQICAPEDRFLYSRTSINSASSSIWFAYLQIFL